MTNDRDWPPDLQALVVKHGGHDKITPAAWREFDAAMVQWHIERRVAAVGYVTEPEEQRRQKQVRRRK